VQIRRALGDCVVADAFFRMRFINEHRALCEYGIGHGQPPATVFVDRVKSSIASAQTLKSGGALSVIHACLTRVWRASALLLALACGTAAAAEFPTKSVRFIVPWP